MKGLVLLYTRAAVCLALVASLGACGGGSDPAESAAPLRSIPSGALRAQQSATATSAPALTVAALLDWAESRYPDLFPHGGEAVYAFGPYAYRYYAATGNYIGIAAGAAYVMGPVAPGGAIAYVGELHDFYCQVYPQWCGAVQPALMVHATQAIGPLPWVTQTSVTLPESIAANVATMVFEGYRLSAENGSFTIDNVTAADHTGISSPYVYGLSNGQVVNPGAPVDFSLQTNVVRRSVQDVQFSFRVRETGATFNYRVAFTVE